MNTKRQLDENTSRTGAAIRASRRGGFEVAGCPRAAVRHPGAQNPCDLRPMSAALGLGREKPT